MTHSIKTQGHGEQSRTMKNFYNKACPQRLGHSSGRRGISMIEIVVVVAVLGIIFSIVIPQFSKIKENQVLKNGVEDIISSINKARGQTLASLNSSEYGVHFDTNEVIIFKGMVFSDLAEDNEVINMISPATISDISLTGVGADIFFSRLSGTPSATGTVTVSTSSFSKIITISATGVVSVE